MRKQIALITAAFLLFLCSCTEDRFIPSRTFSAHAAANRQFTMADVFGDTWDIAYLDPMNYGAGEYLKWKYGLSFTADSELHNRHIGDEATRHVFFFKDGELVFEVMTELLVRQLEVIHPDTVFYSDAPPENSSYYTYAEIRLEYYDQVELDYPLATKGETEEDYIAALRNDPVLRKYVEYGRNLRIGGDGKPLQKPFEEMIPLVDGVHKVFVFYAEGTTAVTIDTARGCVETVEQYSGHTRPAQWHVRWAKRTSCVLSGQFCLLTVGAHIPRP